MFKIKKIQISDGNSLVAILHQKDAEELGLQPKEKIEVMCSTSKKKIICDLEIYSPKTKKNLSLKQGEIGIYQKAFEKLDPHHFLRAKVLPAPKPKSLEYIRKKFEENREIKENEFVEILQDILENKYSDITKTFFVLACASHDFTLKETIGLTKAMVAVGKTLTFGKDEMILDKHCIGGVPNNRTTIVVIPIVAAAGLKIPKTSSRAITSPAGTADTMEVLANVTLPLSHMKELVQEHNGCLLWGGGSKELSPADDIIIEIEHPLEIDSEGQMIASILSKKKCAGSTHVLIDIPIGETAKIRTKEKALRLKEKFEKVGKAIGLTISVIITDGSEPIGNGIGPALEAQDVLKVLRNDPDAPEDLKEKSLEMAGMFFEMTKLARRNRGYGMAKQILESGKAFEKFEEIRHAQGYKKEIPKAKFSEDVCAKHSGKITSMHNKLISRTAFLLGCPKMKEAGMYLHKKVGDNVKKGDVLLTLYSNSKLKLKYAQTFIEEHKEIITISSK
jgi:thymidine phosphorylase